jgi:CitMHS family citrate-Mg2+:H+ or citrate-Ca2+:H+ symporter
MYLGIMGFLTMAIIIILLLKSKTVPSIAFIAVPVIMAIIGGCSIADIGEYVKAGVLDTAPTATLFIFSILFFGIMSDVGMFDRIIDALVKRAGNSVLAITMLTALVAMIGHLDGGGASTFLITIPAMLPIYKKMNMRKTTLMTICTASMGVMNLLPWGGPTMRAASVLEIDATALWKQLIPMQFVGIFCAFGLAFILGRIEKKRGAGYHGNAAAEVAATVELKENAFARPKLFWFNIALTLGVILTLVFITEVPSYLIFMLGVVVALMVNYPGKDMQDKIIKSHSAPAILMATTLLTAGVLLGILENSGMMDQMASLLVAVIPEALGPHLAIVIGILSAPLALVFCTDSYFYGVLPIMIGVGARFGVNPAEIAIAMIVCRNCASFISPVVPATFLGCGLAEIEINEHIKKSFVPVFAISMICLVCGIFFGIIKL